MHVNWIFGAVTIHFEHVVSNFNLQQIVKHLGLGLPTTKHRTTDQLSKDLRPTKHFIGHIRDGFLRVK